MKKSEISCFSSSLLVLDSTDVNDSERSLPSDTPLLVKQCPTKNGNGILLEEVEKYESFDVLLCTDIGDRGIVLKCCPVTLYEVVSSS